MMTVLIPEGNVRSASIVRVTPFGMVKTPVQGIEPAGPYILRKFEADTLAIVQSANAFEYPIVIINTDNRNLYAIAFSLA
jgi:hypothetical protein